MDKQNKKNEYSIIQSKGLAYAIQFLTHEKFYIYQDRENNNKEYYSFCNTKKFQYAKKKICNLLKELENIE